MPRRAARPCTRQPCDQYQPCFRHGYRRPTLSASARGYGAEWQRIRMVVLAEEPWCPGYPDGHHGAAKVRTNSVDHKIPKSRGGTDARDNLRGICGSCNSRKAVAEEGARPR